MYAVCQLHDARSRGEGTNSYQKTNAVEREKSAADALQSREEKRRPIDELGVALQGILDRSLRISWRGLGRFACPLRGGGTQVAALGMRKPLQVDGRERRKGKDERKGSALGGVMGRFLATLIACV